MRVGFYARVSSDRLARRYAYQVLLTDELARSGVELVFLNRAVGASPEDALQLQVQGVVSEYERAKIAGNTSAVCNQIMVGAGIRRPSAATKDGI